MKLLLECRTFKNEKMKMLSNLVSEIGDVIDSLTLSSKEKMQLRANLTEVLSRFEADLQREQSAFSRQSPPQSLKIPYSFFYSGDNDYRNSVVSFCNTALLLISDFFPHLLQNRKKRGII